MSTVQDIINAVAAYNATAAAFEAENVIKNAALSAVYTAGVDGQAAVDAAIEAMGVAVADAQAIADAAAPNLAPLAYASQETYQAVLAAVNALET
jgi:hypothetical protein